MSKLINLGKCNVTGDTDMQPGWKTAASNTGLNVKELQCVTWHVTGGKIPENAVAFFKVRWNDPTNYVVPRCSTV